MFKTIIPLKAKEIVQDNWEEVRGRVRRKFGDEFGESAELVLKLIFENTRISAFAIAGKMGISARGVEKQLAKLRSTGILERIGSPRAGYWKINS